MNAGSTKHIHHEDREDRRAAGKQGSAERLVDRVVDNLTIYVPELPAVLANSVKDDDGVRQRVPRKRQERRHDQEGEFLVQYVESPDYGQDVVKCG